MVVDFDRLAEGVVVTGLGELRLAFGELGYDLVGRDAGGWRGVELAESDSGAAPATPPERGRAAGQALWQTISSVRYSVFQLRVNHSRTMLDA